MVEKIIGVVLGNLYRPFPPVGHLKWWFRKGISPPKKAETFRLRIYNTMPRLFFFLKMVVLSGGESSEENLNNFPINFGISDLGNMTMKHFCTDDG